MQTYIVRVYRARPEDQQTIAGVIEEIESGQKALFKSLTDLQCKLAHSIERGQLELTGLVSEELTPLARVAMSN